MPQIMNSGDGFLPLIAALSQVDGRPQQIQLVRDGPLVAILAHPGTPGLNPQGLSSPSPSQFQALHRIQ